MNSRVDRLREAMAEEGVEAFWVTRPENRYYLSGFTGTSGALLITAGQMGFFTDFRYMEQAKQQCPQWEIICAGQPLYESLPEHMARQDINVLGCEGDFLTYREFNSLREKIDPIKTVPLGGMVERRRELKDSREIDLISRSVRLSDLAFAHILPLIKPGVREDEIALELEFFMRRQGASGAAFETIVASGPRSAMPHGVASGRILQAGDFVVMDFGAVFEGYHSDMTRTVVVGQPDRKQLEIYSIVLEAQLAALASVKAGVPAVQVDKAARDIIASGGYGENFGHGTGHGVGLEIHENPRVSAKSDAILEKGMVVTVEPGIYLPGWGGVRIEDMVLVEDGGCRVFTGAPKSELIICG